MVIALGILVLFLFFGKLILAGPHISEPALNISGGVILLLIALRMIFPGRRREEDADGSAKKITVGVNSENPPRIFAEDGKMTGYEADILEEFAERAGYEVEYKSAPFATVLSGVQSGRWDVAMSSIWIKKERAEVMDFADPYYDSGIGLMTRKGGLADLSQMKGKTFGSDTGSADEAWLVDNRGQGGHDHDRGESRDER